MGNKYEENMKKLRSLETYEEKRAFLAKQIDDIYKKKFPVEYKNSNTNPKLILSEELERVELIVERAINEFLNQN